MAMKFAGKTAITLTAIAMIATASMVSSVSVANAGGKDVAKGALLGLGLGLLAGSAHRHRDRDHYVRDCWYEKRWYRDEYGRRYFERVRVCD